MKRTTRQFAVSVTLMTKAKLLVQANSAQEARAAVQEDIESGGETLGDWLIATENTVPFCENEVSVADAPVETDQDPDFMVGANGTLSKTPEVVFI